MTECPRSDQHPEERPAAFAWRLVVPADQRLDAWLAEQVGGVQAGTCDDGSLELSGELRDLPAVYGLVLRLRDAAVPLRSLEIERLHDGRERA